MIALLPCPLACSGSSVFTENRFFFGIGYGVKCDSCGLWLDCRARTKAEAATLWSIRATPSKDPAVVSPEAIAECCGEFKRYEDGVRARQALNEIEVALISIADGVAPADAVQKAFDVINRERQSLSPATTKGSDETE